MRMFHEGKIIILIDNNQELFKVNNGIYKVISKDQVDLTIMTKDRNGLYEFIKDSETDGQ